jgi:phage terminase large subunit-like protein
MPKAKKSESEVELLHLALSELDQSVHQPNILNYGEKDYPEQLRFHRSPCRGRFVSGGNRGGKTDAEVVESIWWATDTHPYLKRPEAWGNGPLQLRFVVVDISKGVEQIMLPKFKRWIPKSYLIGESWDKSWDNANMILTFANGSTIDFVTWGMDMMKLGGVPRHAIFFDEEPPQHIFNESLMRLIDYKGFWVIAATPTKGMGWTFDLLWEPAVSGQTNLIDTFTLSAEQNPYIQAEAEDFDFYMMGMDKEERAVRESGEFVARSGLVFPSFNTELENHIVDFTRADIPRGWAVYASVDSGWNNPTAWLWHAVSPQGRHRHLRRALQEPHHHRRALPDREEPGGGLGLRARRGREDGRPGDEADQRDHRHLAADGVRPQRGLHPRREHPARRDDRRREDAGLHAAEPDLGYWGYNRPKWVIARNCPNFIREMKKLRWATYSSDKQAYEMNKQEVIHKKDDHAFDSARYFATTRPDPSPDAVRQLSPEEKTPVTLTYEALLLRMRNDPEVTFAGDETAPVWASGDQTEWVTDAVGYMEQDGASLDW